MKAISNIKTRYQDYRALDGREKVQAWKEGLINNAIYIMIIIAVIYTYTKNQRFLSTSSIINIISLSAANIPIACGIAGTSGSSDSAGYPDCAHRGWDCRMGKRLLRRQVSPASIYRNFGHPADCLWYPADVHHVKW